jgi:hypothetical protein
MISDALDDYKNNLIPKDFDWKSYLIMNSDLISANVLTETAATEHYIVYGNKEGRQYYDNKCANYFLFCGAKTGSTTLFKTFNKNKMKTFRCHSIGDYKNEYEKHYGCSIFDFINKKAEKEKVYIVDSYRNPVERKMSAFFQNFDEKMMSLPIETLVRIFNDKYIEKNYHFMIHFEAENKDNILKLLEKELNTLIIDEIHDYYISGVASSQKMVSQLYSIFENQKKELELIYLNIYNLNNCDYSHPMDELFRHYNISETFTEFDFEKKYAIREHNNITFIKLRFSDIDEWDKILSNAFDKKMTLKSDNLSINKKYAEIYKKFKQEYRIPKQFLKELLKDEHFNAYNTSKEKNDYFNYWLARSC